MIPSPKMSDLLRQWLGETVTVAFANGQGVRGIVTTVSDEVVVLRAEDGGLFGVRVECVILATKQGRLSIATPRLVGPGGLPQ